MTSGEVDQHPLRCMEIHGGHQAIETVWECPGVEIWVSSEPYGNTAEGGGDVHYLSLCGGGMVTRFILADISGHGAKVSEVSQVLRNLMRNHINKKSQAELVRDLNQSFGKESQAWQFATAVVGTYLVSSRELMISNAGHPRPFIYKSEDKRWLVLDREIESEGTGLVNLPLGMEDSTAYVPFTLQLDPGDWLFLYTDGAIECQRADGSQLGEEGLMSMVSQIPIELEPKEFGERILHQIHAFHEPKDAEDDLTLMVIKHHGGSPRRRGVLESLEVYAKVLGLAST